MPDPRLPPELLDHIVDFLHDKDYALRNCSLVSKSWISCARKHLFANITFSSAKSLQSWKELFPYPSSSPSYHTHTLSVTYSPATTAACDWIKGFSRVVHFVLTCKTYDANEPAVSLIPFQGFSPIVKTFRVFFAVLPSSQIFNLILSFPLLQDLCATSCIAETGTGDGSDGTSTAIRPSSPPVLTGALILWMGGGLKPIIDRLLSLQELRFWQLTLTLVREGDLSSAKALVEGCSSTLEFLDVTRNPTCTSVRISARNNDLLPFPGGLMPISIDLSKARKLKDVTFTFGRPNPIWVLAALQTITHEHRTLQQITLHLPIIPFDPTPTRIHPADVQLAIGETRYRHWLELDHLLVQLWEAQSMRLKVVHAMPSRMDWESENSCVDILLPEVMRRGVADLVKRRW